MTDVTEQARAFAAAFLSGLRRQDLAAMVLAGAGDDFPEVLAATALIEDLSARSDHFAAALKTYADPSSGTRICRAGRWPCTIRAQWRATCWRGASRFITASEGALRQACAVDVGFVVVSGQSG
jgi:hypothetical protein